MLTLRYRKHAVVRPMDAVALLWLARRAGGGYAHDLLVSAAQTPCMFSLGDADALVRTLVLDEGWSADDARVAYLLACRFADANGGGHA